MTTPSMVERLIDRALAPYVKRIKALEKVIMKLKPRHKRHVKIPKRRIRARTCPHTRPQGNTP